MSRFVRIAPIFAVVLLCSSVVMAQDAGPRALINLTGSFGAGLVVIGAAAGIGKLAAAALESMARQPEAAGGIQTAMIIAAALIEGFMFFALYICMVPGT